MKMKRIMREDQLKEEQAIRLSERKRKGEQLVETWAKKRGMEGEKLIQTFESNPSKAMNVAFVLENMKNYLSNLTETTISNTFQTTPENVMRVVRLGYGDSIRGDVFLEWGMESARDSIYYLSPVYVSSTRGATANAVTHESSAYRYASEVEEESLGTGDGSTTEFSGSLANYPLRPYTVTVFVAGKPVGKDDGNGEFDGDLSGTINYDTTGEYDITFTSAPASGADVLIQYNFDSEESTQYTDVKMLDLRLTDYQFRVKPYPLGVSWSKMVDLLLSSTLNIDAEETLLTAVADELRKSLDFEALKLGKRYADKNTGASFDGTPATGESVIDKAQSVTRIFEDASNVIYNQLQRGGITKFYAAGDVITYLKYHKRFQAVNSSKIGAFKVGTLDGVDIFKVPTDITPAGSGVGVWRNDNNPNDVAIACGVLVPMYATQKMEYRNFYTEQGVASFGDNKVLNEKYLVPMTFTNLT